jgi:hypothetical protein
MEVALLQSRIDKATVADIRSYNTLVKRIRETCKDSYLEYQKLSDDPTKMFTQVITDAAFKNREDAMQCHKEHNYADSVARQHQGGKETLLTGDPEG